MFLAAVDWLQSINCTARQRPIKLWVVSGEPVLEYALTPIAFAEALDRTADRRRHLLLGNGFSIAVWPDFRYDALLTAGVGQNQRVEALFAQFETVDFERVGRALLETQAVLSVHDGAGALAARVAADYRDLRRLLVSAITRIHPAAPAVLEGRFEPCADFLEDFIGVARRSLWGKVFTTNYDLLLYWTLMRRVDDLAANDGFRGKPLTWQPQVMQAVFYLHGALHLFEKDGVTQKLSAPGRLVDTVGKRIERDDVPLFISEGSSQEKRVRIAESDYLTTASECLTAACDDPYACLFIFGHSLREEDEHIFEKIAEGQIEEVFVSVRPADTLEARARIRATTELWAEKRARRNGPPLTVFSYDPAEAAPWG